MANTSNQGNDSTTYLTNNATTVIKAKAGYLGKLVITNVGTTATVTIYDNASAASGSILWAWVSADGKVSIDLKAKCSNGITIIVNSGGTVAGYVTFS